MLSNAVVALKVVKLSEDEGMPNTALREISILKKLRHVNVLPVLDVIHTESQLVIVLEYLERDLKKLLSSAEPLDTVGLIGQLIEGVRYIHAEQIVHRDLKPQNILVSKTGCLKIADFGLARSFEVKMPSYSSEVVTLWYRPPELLKGCKVYGYAVDIWSLGCIISEIMTRSPLFPGSDKQDQMSRISKYTSLQKARQMEYLLNVHPKTDPAITGLIFECLKEQPNKRITALESLEYFRKHIAK